MIKYGDKVKVTEGFYEGCKGRAVDCTILFGAILYDVEIVKEINGTMRIKIIEVHEKNLEKVKEEK